jgi:putative endonuclease
LSKRIVIARPVRRTGRSDLGQGGEMQRQYYVYVMTNKDNHVLYTGVTSDLKKRIFQHKNNLAAGFTSRYNVHKLVYFEIFEDSYNAISREKQIKAGSRQKKLELVAGFNPIWKDLYDDL